MASFNKPFHISVKGTNMMVLLQMLAGRRVFNISFEDLLPSILITRKKDIAGFYWIALNQTSFKDVENIGRCIVDYFERKANRSGRSRQ